MINLLYISEQQEPKRLDKDFFLYKELGNEVTTQWNEV